MLNWVIAFLAVLGAGAIICVVTHAILSAAERRRKFAVERAADAAIKRYVNHYGSTDQRDSWSSPGRAKNASASDLERLADRVATLEAKKTKKEKAHD